MHIVKRLTALMLMVENDDKIYNAGDVLDLCRELKLPMVVDIHHDRCNPSDKDIGEYIELIFDTRENRGYLPRYIYPAPKMKYVPFCLYLYM